MDPHQTVDTRLMLAVIEIAKDECARGDWDRLEPALEAAWERLRTEDAPPWSVVADEVLASCEAARKKPPSQH